MADDKTARRRQRAPRAQPDADAPASETPAAAPAPAVEDRMVEVNNLRHMNYTQPSTGVRIHGGARRVKALDDGWLRAQLAAGLLERA